MSTPLGSIQNWSDAQLTEDMNDKDGVSVAKYNERQRQAKVWKEEVEWRACEEAEHCQAEEQQRLEAERRRSEERRVGKECA